MSRRFTFSPRGARELRQLDPEQRRRILAALERLENQSAGDVRPLRGPYSGCFRLRLGKWRVLYRTVEPDQFEIFRVDNRGEVY